MKRKILFLICVFMSFLVSSIVLAAASTADADSSALTTTSSGSTTDNSATAEKKATFHVVCAYDHNTPITNLDIYFKNPSNGEMVSGTTDAQGNISFSEMNGGVYNVYMTDTYGNYVSAESSVSITTDEPEPLMVPVPLAKLQVIYQNSSLENYQEPSYTVSGTFDKIYKLAPLAAGTSVTNESGYVATGASYLVTVKSEKGIIGQSYFAIPSKTGNFYIQIYDRNLNIFMKNIRLFL
ncbi:hypothetical protein [Pectinatus frisingensis]|uniref:hypothetical protein n=1 Tax=Pectinatus frisingensis TaxID=865 RepID=UPI003D804EC0